MGIACRVFFLDDNDSLQRIPMARLDRLLHFDRKKKSSTVRWETCALCDGILGGGREASTGH